MTDLPVVDTALEGFRLTRERPLAVALWAAVLLAGQAASSAVLIASGRADALNVMRQAPTTPAEATARLEALAPALPALGLASLIGAAATVIVFTAVLRAVLTPERSRAGYLRLGADELRQFGVWLALLVVAWLALFAALVGTTVIVAPLAAMAGGPQPLITSLMLAVTATLMLLLLVRLSLAPAQTQGEGRIALLRSWPMTKGLFWPLFGAYVLALTLAAVVSLLASVLLAALWALAVGGDLGSAAAVLQPDLSSWAGVVRPASVGGLVFNALLTALLLTIAAAPGAAAYRMLARRDPAPSF